MHIMTIITNIGDVLVLFSGYHNKIAGPDYQNAIIRLPSGNLFKGSVEIHKEGKD